MMAAVVKEVWAAKVGYKPEDVVSVSIMPCTAKKREAERPEMVSAATGARDTDYVLTTRELGRMFRWGGEGGRGRAGAGGGAGRGIWRGRSRLRPLTAAAARALPSARPPTAAARRPRPLPRACMRPPG
jgi:hypothetical protein